MKKIDMEKIDWPHIGMTLAETACALRVHPRTVQIAIVRGGLPARKVGVSWRIDPDAVRAWLASGGSLPEESDGEELEKDVC